MNITFIGNCQTVGLCFYFQKMLNSRSLYNVAWVSYGEDITQHLGNWSLKCENKITDYENSIQRIKDSDVIVYQNVAVEKSLFSNTQTLRKIKKNTCKIIQIPSIYLIYDDFENSIVELIRRENKNNVDVRVSKILMKFRHENLMLTSWHPSTFLFLEITKELCKMINLTFFRQGIYNYLLKNSNYMELPE